VSGRDLGVAGDLYFVLHEERTGVRQAPERVAGILVATALIGELVLSGHLVLTPDAGLDAHRSARAPLESLGRDLVQAVGDPRQDRALSGWLAFLALDAVHDVQRRLLRAGILIAVSRRRLGTRRTQLLAVDSTTAAWPGIRLARQLSGREQVTLPDALLIALVQVSGLMGRVLWDPADQRHGHDHVRAVCQALPPPLALLVAHADTAVADQVLTGVT